MKPSLEQLIQQLEHIIQQLTALETVFDPGHIPTNHIQTQDQKLLAFF